MSKFNHKETSTTQEIKLLKKKFELIERNRSLRILLQISGNHSETTYAEDGQTTEDRRLSANEDESAFKREKSNSCISNSLKLDSTPSDEKYILRSFVNRLVIYPRRLIVKKKEVPVKSPSNGPIRRFIHLMIWWCNCKKRPTSNTKQ